ncbi:hypothetical protein NE237_004983 [Protea cynaroides]|uniref:Protein kinase domain-containing protein n=1 Tax=Protea cynaroides TaxID=273540 RepID=A0A9Q0KJZ0_9MAGN|nr:hypothetical protein NE237_004983 [Protea cynaroides]
MEEKSIFSRCHRQWVRSNCIGKGSFGTVSLASFVSDSRVFAVKSVNLNSSFTSHLESLENEIQILRSLSSPYVVQYLGEDLTQESGNVIYRNLHMEYLPGGTATDMASRFCGKGNDLVRSYTWCIVSALSYIHSKGFVHCDVKGRNVLLGSSPASGVAKLADFGSARPFYGQKGTTLPRGSPLWMAPEVIRGERQGPESDVWSLGCTVIEMITGKPGWEDCGSDTLCRIAFSDQLPEFPAELSELGREFLDNCLRREPSERWSCEQLLHHPFVSVGTVADSSPRSILNWPTSKSTVVDDDDGEEEESEFGFNRNGDSDSQNSNPNSISAKDRIRELATGVGVLWESDGWERVRSSGSVSTSGKLDEGKLGTGLAYWNLKRVREEKVDSETWNTVRELETGGSPAMKMQTRGEDDPSAFLFPNLRATTIMNTIFKICSDLYPKTESYRVCNSERHEEERKNRKSNSRDDDDDDEFMGVKAQRDDLQLHPQNPMKKQRLPERSSEGQKRIIYHNYIAEAARVGLSFMMGAPSC